MPANLENSAVATGLEKVSFHSSLKERQCQRMLELPHSCTYCDPYSQRFGLVNKVEIDVSLELSCFFNDPADVGNWISGFSAFSKSSMNIWRFMVHILLTPGLGILSMTLLACEMSVILQ